MAYIEIIDEADASGRLERVYRSARERAGRVFNILKVQSQRPGALTASVRLYLEIMHGESSLTRAERELLAVVVSDVNDCHY